MNWRKRALTIAVFAAVLMVAASAAAASSSLPLLCCRSRWTRCVATSRHDTMINWAKTGFRYLWEKGTVYTDAHHAHANTETVVGHADPGHRGTTLPFMA